MTVSDVELATLATTHDIINLGMLADGERRRRHGTRPTVVRVTVHRLQDPDMIPLFKAVVELQRQVGVVRAFAPLPRTMNPAVPTTGYEDVKRIALARLVVDNVPSIQVDWSLYGPKLAQVALTVGADDVDAVSAEDETGEGRRRSPIEEIRRNIKSAGQEPVERNGRFEPLTR